MKLTKCDACGKVVRASDANLFTFKESGGAAVMVKEKNGEYMNISDTERDICRSCSIRILKFMFPNREFLPEDEYVKTPF